MQREGIFREMKQRRAYEKPSERRVREKAEAIRRVKKQARKKAQREGLLPMPKSFHRSPVPRRPWKITGPTRGRPLSLGRSATPSRDWGNDRILDSEDVHLLPKGMVRGCWRRYNLGSDMDRLGGVFDRRDRCPSTSRAVVSLQTQLGA
jgi:small subunit ribosomal protein S21